MGQQSSRVDERGPKNPYRIRSKRPQPASKVESLLPSLNTVLAVGFIFAVGIVAEDLSYKFVDSDSTPFRSIAAIISDPLPDSISKRLNLPTKEGSRLKTMVEDLRGKPHVKTLALDLASHRAFQASAPEVGDKVAKWMCRMNECRARSRADCKKKNIPMSECKWPDTTECTVFDDNDPNLPAPSEVEFAVNSVYYDAKNTVYENGNYYDEMRRIESRRDFSRSIALIAAGYLTLSLVLGLGVSFYVLVVYLAGRKSKRDFVQRWREILPVWLIFFVIYFMGMWAYEREADEFHKRAYGYYSTMLSNKTGAVTVPCGTILAGESPAPSAVSNVAPGGETEVHRCVVFQTASETSQHKQIDHPCSNGLWPIFLLWRFRKERTSEQRRDGKFTGRVTDTAFKFCAIQRDEVRTRVDRGRFSLRLRHRRIRPDALAAPN